MGTDFFFVNGVQADRSCRRQIRRHVMMGKNAGRTIRRHSKPHSGASSRQAGSSAIASSIQDGAALRKEDAASLSYGLYNTVAVGSFPLAMTANMMHIMDEFFNLTIARLYPLQLGISIHDVKRSWAPMLFADEDTCRCNLALMQASNEVLLRDGETSQQSLQHLSQTFALVKSRLESDHALSDATIGIVSSLVNHEQLRSYHAAAAIHFQGLRRIVELRGGLAGLQKNRSVRSKVCKTDIIFALQYGAPPMFHYDRRSEVRSYLESQPLSYDLLTPTPLPYEGQLAPALREIIVDIVRICTLFNVHDPGRIELKHFLDILLSICYRLLNWRSLNESRQSPGLESIYHVGSTMFMMTLFMQHNHRRILDHTFIFECLRDLMSFDLSDKEDLVLWLTVVGGFWVSSGSMAGWWVSNARATAYELDVKDWNDVRDRIGPLPWINVIHDEPGRRLWTKVYDSG